MACLIEVIITLTINEIKTLIADDAASERKLAAAVGQRYYEADHDIKNYRVFYYNTDGELVEDRAKSNQKISHPFFTELVDQLTAYVLSSKENPIRAVEIVKDLQEQLDIYFDDEFWAECAELVAGTYTKGFDYLYAYKNEENRIAFQYADAMGVVEVRKEDTDDNCAYFIYWYIDRIDKGKKVIKRIQVHTAENITYFVQSGDGEVKLDDNEPINPKPNVIMRDASGNEYGDKLGFIPFFRLDYNRKQHSGLKPIKALIDDYDLMECGLSNNLQDFDHPIYAVRGFEGDNLDALSQNLRTKKTIGVGENGGVDILTIDVPYQARKTKADEDEKNIYRFGMGLNTQGLKDTSATTNLAIQAAYTLLDLKADKFLTRFKKFLKTIIKPVLDEINSANGTGYQLKDIYFDFKPNMLVNEQENIQNEQIKAATKQIEINNILNVAAQIGDEKALEAICEILDFDYEEIKAKAAELQPYDADDAQNLLDEVEPEEDIDEESDGISEGEKQTQQAVLDMLDELLKELE